MREHKFLFLFFLGILITVGVLYFVGTKDVLEGILKLNIEYFLIFLGIQVALMTLWALKWWVILRQHKVPFRKLLPVSYFGYLMNNIAPMSTAGGEAFRAYLLGRVEKISTEDSAASVVVDLFLEVFPLLIMIFIAVFITLTYDINYLVSLVLGLAGLFVLLVLGFIILLIINEKISSILITHTIHFIEMLPIGFLKNHAKDAKTRIDKILINFQRTLRTSIKDNTVVFLGLVIASMIWALSILRMYLIFHMLGIDLPLTTLIVVRVAIVAITFLSLIPGGLGIWEGGSTWLYTLFGMQAATAMAATLVERLFSFWIGSLIGLAASAYIGATQILKKYVQE